MAGPLHFLPGLTQRLLGLLALGDVFREGEQIPGCGAFIPNGDLLRVQDPGAALPSVDGLLGDVDEPPPFQHLPILAREGVGLPPREEVIVILADQLVF